MKNNPWNNNSNIFKISIGQEKSISIKIINRTTLVTNFYNDIHRNQETKSLQLGLHHFNPPPLQSSTKGKFIYQSQCGSPSQRRESLGVEQGVHTFKDKGMKTQYEVKFIQSVFSLKIELFNLFKAWIWLNF